MTAAVSWRAMFLLDAVLAAALVLPVWRYRGATPVQARPSQAAFAAHGALLTSRPAPVL